MFYILLLKWLKKKLQKESKLILMNYQVVNVSV